jgi:hypothetical protein
VVMAIRLVRKEVPQMSDRSSDDPSFVGRSPPPYFRGLEVREISNTRARVTETPKRLFLV